MRWQETVTLLMLRIKLLAIRNKRSNMAFSTPREITRSTADPVLDLVSLRHPQNQKNRYYRKARKSMKHGVGLSNVLNYIRHIIIIIIIIKLFLRHKSSGDILMTQSVPHSPCHLVRSVALSESYKVSARS